MKIFPSWVLAVKCMWASNPLVTQERSTMSIRHLVSISYRYTQYMTGMCFARSLWAQIPTLFSVIELMSCVSN